MQKAMRRAVGVGGAAAVALAASLALAGVADAHVPTFHPGCVAATLSDASAPALTVDLKLYTQNKQDPNTVAVSYLPDGSSTPVTILSTTSFQQSWTSPTTKTITLNKKTVDNPFYVTGKVGGTFTITVTANDDPDGKTNGNNGTNTSKTGQWDGTFTVKVKTCPDTKPSGTPTLPPPTSAPSTSTPSVPSSSSAAPSTSAAAAAPVAAGNSGSGGKLAYTGVSTELPLIIGGALIIIGAAALIGMRIMKRRRAES